MTSRLVRTAPRGGALAILALLLAGGLAGALGGQTYHWTDETGRPRTSSRFEDVPPRRLRDAVCRVEATEVRDGEHLVVQGGHLLRLAGVDAPDALDLDGPEAAAAARRGLRELVGEGALELGFDERLKDGRFATFVWARNAEGLDINREMIRRGLARALIAPGTQRHGAALIEAQSEARAAGRGVWKAKPRARATAGAQPFRGFSLGLYASTEDFDYGPFLREMKEIGSRDVLLITPWFVPDHLHGAFRPRPGRSISMPALRRVMQQAHAVGLRPSLMPIILLEDTGSDYWRGNISPRDPAAWMTAYQEWILRFADCARMGGADVFVIGSELSSMEKYEASWRAVARDVRRRFGGRLSYSANWDHLSTIRWWDELDLIGTTGYHALTKEKDPELDELVASWARIRDALGRTLRPLGKPWFFTELGYASLDGIAANPWDYVTPERTDALEQAACYEAWVRAWSGVPAPFHGAFFYTWWRNGDASDAREYSVHGKPAEAILRRYLGGR